MGFFDIFSSDDDTSYGYKSFKNKNGWDNAKMLELLSSEDSPYGSPKMGWIRAFGKEREVIVYDGAHKTNYVYVDASPKKIVVSMAPKPGQIGGAKDHMGNGEDVEEVAHNTVAATVDSVEAVDRVIEIVKKIIESEK
ncbi:MAG: hypothetical protein J6U54_13900 [Clostridiales bacterium]|nr:hypothetical protein [Clostridiales bacterium]